MTHAIPLSLLTLALVATLGCDRRPHPPSEAKATHEEAGAHAGEGAHLPLKDIRGLSFLVVPEAKAGAAWHPAEAVGDESARPSSSRRDSPCGPGLA